MTLALGVLIFIFGTVIGSFLNVVIYRLPEGQPLTGRSHCPHCSRTLSAWELIPLLSFLALGGSCRNCRKKISGRYFLVELSTGLLFSLSWFWLAPQGIMGVLLLVKAWLLLSALLVIFFIDLDHYLILDKVIFPVAAVLFVFNLAIDIIGKNLSWNFFSFTLGGAAAALAGAAPFFIIWYFSEGRWMGFGDVKMMLLLGVALGWPQVFVALFLGILLGGLASVYLLLWGGKTMKSQVPFGVFLSLAAAVVTFCGPAILNWYFRLLGF